MKRYTAFIIMVLTAYLGYSQKIAYVDTKYILDNIPEYNQAQKDLNDLSIRWQSQIEAKYSEIDQLYKSYQAEQILLTEDMKQKREEEIIKKEKEAKDYQKSKFGVEGELFKKRQELVKPIQDKVYAAIKEVADAGGYAIILDKSEQSNILYGNERYDKSDAVLKKLGYSVESK